MSIITSAQFTDDDTIEVRGFDLKKNGTDKDVELFQSLQGAGNPQFLLIATEIFYTFKDTRYTRDKPNVTVKIRGSNGQWSAETPVTP